jgi:hypothetical protein
VREVTVECGEEVRREREDLGRQVREGREREEGLRGELTALREVRPHPPRCNQ